MIIILDDEPDLVEIYVDTLTTELNIDPKSVMGFTNPLLAVKYIQSCAEEIKLILTDQNMIPLKGMEIIKALRLFGISCQCIIATGAEDPKEVFDLMEFESALGVERKTIFKEKPLDIEAVFADLA